MRIGAVVSFVLVFGAAFLMFRVPRPYEPISWTLVGICAVLGLLGAGIYWVLGSKTNTVSAHELPPKK